MVFIAAVVLLWSAVGIGVEDDDSVTNVALLLVKQETKKVL
jgi:hypothetical protein